MASKPAHPILVQLQRGAASDRAAIMRMRAPPASRPFVHFNWFWLDRALADPEIRVRLIRRGPRRGLVGVIAFGPHEAVDLDPSSRRHDIGEVYHVVIGENFAGRGLGVAAVHAAAKELAAAWPAMHAIRVGHNPKNVAAAAFFRRLGFKHIGEKVDGETGTRDVLLEMPLARLLTSPQRAS